ncbi:MAG: hypothetical protein IPI67_26655 [Myxococcales bacterium]|nr:hypothetical protein [Myxococcales bacterium]
MRHLFLVACCSFLAACGGASSTDGDPGGTGGIGGQGGIGGTGGSGAGSGDGGTTSLLVGVWKGYVTNFTLADGTDTVTLTIDDSGPVPGGHVVFGDAASLPAPTNPDIGYPPGVESVASNAVVTGFAYTVLQGSLVSDRLKFKLTPGEVWTQWCEMQAPIADETNPGSYSCVHNWGYGSDGTKCYQDNPNTGQKVFIDCGKLHLCQNVCQCSATKCSTNLTPSVAFDLQLQGSKATGGVLGLDDSEHKVDLTHL